jgi:hypothetical protein
MPEAIKRIEAVQRFRLASKSPPTRKLAATPTRFHVENMPTSDFLLIPKVSSERRSYIPMAFVGPDTLCSDLVFIFREATIFHFGILSSAMHMAWVRSVCGRLKSDYRYSAGIVYNNFPWPQAITDKQQQAIEAASQGVLEARAHYPDASLAALYDPLTMPPDLVKAHRKLDAAVDAAYAKRKFSGDRDRLAFLFELYQQILSPLSAKKNLRRK